MADTDLQRIREEITKLICAKSRSEPRTWNSTDFLRYRNLCELEQTLLALDRLDLAAS